MIEILETAETVKRLGLKWTNLASKHSVAMKTADDDRNLIAGQVFETRKELDCALSHIESAARSIVYPTDAEIEFATLQVCDLHGLQVND
jgi:hypothetical protein